MNKKSGKSARVAGSKRQGPANKPCVPGLKEGKKKR